MAFDSPQAGRLVDRLGTAPVIAAGMVAFVAAYALGVGADLAIVTAVMDAGVDGSVAPAGSGPALLDGLQPALYVSVIVAIRGLFDALGCVRADARLPLVRFRSGRQAAVAGEERRGCASKATRIDSGVEAALLRDLVAHYATR